MNFSSPHSCAYIFFEYLLSNGTDELHGSKECKDDLEYEKMFRMLKKYLEKYKSVKDSIYTEHIKISNNKIDGKEC